MSYHSAFLTSNEGYEPETQKELDDLEFQLFRMKENMRKIAKKWQVLGIDKTPDDKWVIVYALDNGRSCQVMLSDCESPYRNIWDFAIQAKYTKKNEIHIGDIKGPENMGYGSICIDYLKEIARQQNIPFITGDIAERDWDHLDRLIHFYRKHHFRVNVDYKNKCGEIEWSE